MTTVPKVAHKSHELLQHSLGIERNRTRQQWGFRNHFCCEIGFDYYSDCLALVEAGLMHAGRIINDGRDQYFHVTAKGCEAAGLSMAKIKQLTKERRVVE